MCSTRTRRAKTTRKRRTGLITLISVSPITPAKETSRRRKRPDKKVKSRSSLQDCNRLSSIFMRGVPLTKGKIAIIDDEDYARVVQHRWFASLINGHWYAYHDFRQKNGKYKHVSMHGFILAAPRGTHIDHINNDGLDNRKSNLRLATPAQNARNCAKYRNNSSGRSEEH